MQPVLVISVVLLWVIVLFNLLLTLGLIRRVNTTPAMPQGEPAPDFTAVTLNGDSVTLAQFRGHELTLLFMSSTCSPCVEKISELETLAPEMERRGITFALVFKQSAAEIKTFVEQYQPTMPIWIAPLPNPFWRDYKVAGTPFYCLVNANQIVSATGFHDSIWKA